MDGVLADFEAGFFKVSGQDLSLLPDDVFADRETKDKVFAHPTFFLDLPILAGAVSMVEYALGFDADVKVLTATGYSNEEGVAAQKKEWIARHFPAIKEVYTVPKSDMKAGIHHTSPADTKRQLDKVWKEMEDEPTPKPSWHTTEGWHNE
jgi:5'(3')-deoxyribonucleotidase